MNFPIVPPLDVTEGQPSGSSGLVPQIIWRTMLLGESGYEEGDVRWFPENDQYRVRHKLGIGGAMSAKFRSAVRLARDGIWVVDDYLLVSDKSAERLTEMLFDTCATDIKLATADNDGAEDRANDLKALELDLQKHNPATRVHISLNLRKTESRDMLDVHDRFAIIDDVLWHCGWRA